MTDPIRPMATANRPRHRPTWTLTAIAALWAAPCIALAAGYGGSANGGDTSGLSKDGRNSHVRQMLQRHSAEAQSQTDNQARQSRGGPKQRRGQTTERGRQQLKKLQRQRREVREKMRANDEYRENNRDSIEHVNNDMGIDERLARERGQSAPDRRSYSTIRLGAAMPQDVEIGAAEHSMDTGFIVNLATGKHVGNHLRLEGEFGYITADASDFNDTYESVQLMGNAYIDMPEARFLNITPYVGAGVGGALNWASGNHFPGSEQDFNFAYQGRVGINWNISPKYALDLGYRYFATSDPEFDGYEASWGNHNIELGLVARFN